MCKKLLWVRCRWLLSFLSLMLRSTIKDNECNHSVLTNSFDFNSLLNNIPKAETIQICAEALYSLQHSPAPFSRHIFVELWRWPLFLSILASMTSCITRSTKLPRDHPLDQLLPIFLLATINLNFFRPLSSQRYITAIWMTLS